jgi:hypothetical protein
MALRTFLRLLTLALATAPLSFLLWDVAGLLPLLVGLGLMVSALGYLLLLTGEGELTRWQLRYQLDDRADREHLEQVLRFLVEKTGHFVLEANAQGLFLELPEALDRYVEAQLPRALPELRLIREEDGRESLRRGSFFLGIGAPRGEALHWATEGETRQMRLHIHQGPHATLIARTRGEVPPGRWLRLPRLLKRLWYRLPLWDELSKGVRLSSLLPSTGDGAAFGAAFGAVYSSRSRLLDLAPPDDYLPDPSGRELGLSIDGRWLTVGHDLPLFTVGAPLSFLIRQALDDLAMGRSVVVLSPHRRILERIAQQAGDTAVHWLDPQNSRGSAHLAIARAEEWGTANTEAIVQAAQTFLADLGLDVELPAVGDFTRRLFHTLVEFACQTGQDLTFTDLYAVSQSTLALRSFLTRTQSVTAGIGSELLAQLDGDAGYVQAVTVLSAIRAALKPLESGPLHTLCQPPFLDARQVLWGTRLLLVPMTNADFPEQDRLLSAMLDLAVSRVLASEENVFLDLHLHDPHLYRQDEGRRWIERARQDPRISCLFDVHDPDSLSSVHDQQSSQIVFRCSEGLASRLISEWGLPASISDMTGLPAGTALARLFGQVVTLKGSE